MIKNYLVAFIFAALLGCGGGGGSTGTANVQANGRVLNIETGARFPSPATVQSSASLANTSVVDGSFTLSVARGTTQISVNPPPSVGFPSTTFGFPNALTAAQNDVGDLWVGPQQVTLSGTIRNSANGDGIANALVQFAGRFATTSSAGAFSISNVAYSNANTASFLGLVGRVNITGFFASEFTTGGATATSGVVNVGDILVTPLSSENPPGLPYTIWGNVSPRASSSGTIVTLRDNSNVVIRRFTVGIDGRYQFWVPVGSYTVSFQNGTLTAPNQSVTLNTTTDIVQANATLN